MPERSSKRKARRDSVSTSICEPQTSSLRTENIPSISDKDFSELSEKIEKSVCRRIKDTEVGQREILRVIENLSSKIDSLSDKTPPTTNNKAVKPDFSEPGPSSQREDIYELSQSQGQHTCDFHQRKLDHFVRSSSHSAKQISVKRFQFVYNILFTKTSSKTYEV